MTRLSAERITGLEVRELAFGGGKPGKFSGRCYAAYDGDQRVAIAQCAGATRTIQCLVDRVYQIRSTQTRHEQNYRCCFCFQIKPLEIDHIVPRARGRDDRRTNLRAACSQCHTRRHREPARKIPIHPGILKLMEAVGYVWSGEEVGWQPKSLTSPNSKSDSSSTSNPLSSDTPSVEL